MKGFGFFVISIILLSAVLAEQAQSHRAAREMFSEQDSKAAKFSRLAALRNAIQKSYQKTDKFHLDSWKISVQTTLAREYGATVLINGSKVTIISDELRARGEFYLR